MKCTDPQAALSQAEPRQGECASSEDLLARGVHFGHNRALYEAIRHSHLDAARALIDSGADACAREGLFVRMVAAAGNADLLKLLLENQAHAHAGDAHAMRMAASRGHVHVMQLLVQYKANVTVEENVALRIGAQNGHADMVRFLIAHKADVSARGHHALIMAAGRYVYDSSWPVFQHTYVAYFVFCTC